MISCDKNWFFVSPSWPANDAISGKILATKWNIFRHPGQCSVAGSAALQAVWSCSQCGVAGSAALQAAGSAALQAVWRCRQCGVPGSMALQAVRRCRQCGVAGNTALQVVSEWLSMICADIFESIFALNKAKIKVDSFEKRKVQEKVSKLHCQYTFTHINSNTALFFYTVNIMCLKNYENHTIFVYTMA